MDRFQEVDLHGKGVCRTTVRPEVVLDDGTQRYTTHGNVEAGTLGALVVTQQAVAYQAFSTTADGGTGAPRLPEFESMRRMVIDRTGTPAPPGEFAEAYAPPGYFWFGSLTYTAD